MTINALEPLFQPVKVGNINLLNRVAMTAMTRTRNDPVTELPREINVQYYSQRASPGTLLVSEGTAPTANGRGYVRAPNLYEPASAGAWKAVTDAVHGKGAFIYAQLMHAGRVSHSSLLDGATPLAPSAIKMGGQVHTKTGKADYEVPVAMTIDQIDEAVQGFASAARMAVDAGFDGVEIHGANGYLVQQFLSSKANIRTDEYGGPIENRARFLLRVVDACVDAIGAARVALKIAPGVSFSEIVEDEAEVAEQLQYLAPELSSRKLAYLCLTSWNYEPYFRFVGLTDPNVSFDVWTRFRSKYDGTLMINGGLAFDKAAEYVSNGTADLVGFATAFVATPNLVDVLQVGALDKINWGGYGKDPAKDAEAYVDWPEVAVK